MNLRTCERFREAVNNPIAFSTHRRTPSRSVCVAGARAPVDALPLMHRSEMAHPSDVEMPESNPLTDNRFAGTLVVEKRRSVPADVTNEIAKVDAILKEWQSKSLDSNLALEKLIEPLVKIHFFVWDTEREYIAGLEDVARQRFDQFRAVLDASPPEVKKKWGTNYRLRLLAASGYPMGENFWRDAIELKIRALQRPTDDDSCFDHIGDKRTVDKILVRWVSGDIDDKIAMVNLRSFALKYSGESVRPDEVEPPLEYQQARRAFAIAMVRPWEMIIDQAESGLSELEYQEYKEVLCERSTGLSFEDWRRALRLPPKGPDGNAR